MQRHAAGHDHGVIDHGATWLFGVVSLRTMVAAIMKIDTSIAVKPRWAGLDMAGVARVTPESGAAGRSEFSGGLKGGQAIDIRGLLAEAWSGCGSAPRGHSVKN